ncbi:MAG: MFS transporter [Betaproteobacteria bacterium]|nr:MAG: MFS transporter [Betaproteobacteria bacterium]
MSEVPRPLAIESDSSSLLAHRSFVLFWFARVAAMVAHQMLAVGVGWQVYALTGSALDLGLVGLAQFIPSFLLMLVAGHVADRFDRRRVLQACMVVEALAAGGLALGSYQGWITEHLIFALIFIVGAARAFQMPAMAALLPLLVPRRLFPRALATNSAAGQAAIIVGPALGGFVYVAGPAAVYATSVALFLLTGMTIYLVRLAHAQGRFEEVGLDSVFAGIRYIRRHPTVLGAISLDLFAVLLGGATALLPVYARDILATGPWGLGLLRSSTAVGALAMAIYLARRPLKRHAGRLMFGAVALFGIATIIFGVSSSFTLSLIALSILGASDMVSVVVRSSLVQLQTPDAMRGRVSAVNALFIGTSNQLGEFESGVTAAWFGVVPSVVIGGLGTLLIVGLWMRLFPSLVRVDRLDTPASKNQLAAKGNGD